MAQVLICWPVTTVAQAQSHAGSYGICGRQSGTGTGFAEHLAFSPSVSFHQCSILIYLLMLYNLSS
jgi:hypothetical protein